MKIGVILIAIGFIFSIIGYLTLGNDNHYIGIVAFSLSIIFLVIGIFSELKTTRKNKVEDKYN